MITTPITLSELDILVPQGLQLGGSTVIVAGHSRNPAHTIRSALIYRLTRVDVWTVQGARGHLVYPIPNNVRGRLLPSAVPSLCLIRAFVSHSRMLAVVLAVHGSDVLSWMGRKI